MQPFDVFLSIDQLSPTFLTLSFWKPAYFVWIAITLDSLLSSLLHRHSRSTSFLIHASLLLTPTMEQIEQAVICALDPHVDPNLKAQVRRRRRNWKKADGCMVEGHFRPGECVCGGSLCVCILAAIHQHQLESWWIYSYVLMDDASRLGDNSQLNTVLMLHLVSRVLGKRLLWTDQELCRWLATMSTTLHQRTESVSQRFPRPIS